MVQRGATASPEDLRKEFGCAEDEDADSEGSVLMEQEEDFDASQVNDSPPAACGSCTGCWRPTVGANGKCSMAPKYQDPAFCAKKKGIFCGGNDATPVVQ